VLDVVNDLKARSNGAGTNQRPPKAGERRRGGASAVGFELPPSRVQSYRATSRRLTIAIILTFWTLQYLVLSILFEMMNPGAARAVYFPRAIVSGLGVLMSFVMVAVQNRLRGSTLSLRAAIAVLMVPVCPVLMTIASVALFAIIMPHTPGTGFNWSNFLQDYLYRLWVFVGLSAIILALSYAADIREREERINALQALAHAAQLRALRNQLNPHFLFNALNSIAGLMSRKRGPEAETMTENLADFLRTTLALDPQKVITLDEEIRLQQLYLDIEQVRFPERLLVSFAIPEELRNALVPSLITQPLIENSIKYAVARSTEPVQVSISAAAQDGRLELTVEDDGGNAENGSIKSSRTGLSNVAERLQAHYGDGARLMAAGKEAGGFRNVVSLPLRFG